MDATQFYAIAAGGIIGLLLIFRFLICVIHFLQPWNILFLRYIIYPYFLKRRYLLGPWTRAKVSLQLLYLAVNIFCNSFRVSTIKEAGVRAGTLSLINLIPVYFGVHLSFLGDLLGISLPAYHFVHRSTGTVSVMLGLFHVLVNVAGKASLSYGVSGQLFGLIGIVSISSLLILASPFIRRLSYELFLRSHQALAATTIYSLWQHVGPGLRFPRLYILILGCAFLATFILEWCTIMYRNISLHRGYSKALIMRDHGRVRMNIPVARPWEIKAGQYINVWIPSTRLWSFGESHPFMIPSWSDASIDLLIEPRNGFTRRLFNHARECTEVQDQKNESDFYHVIFSGPHGLSAPVGDYGSVLMIATGFGIVAQLPYLKELIRGFNRCQFRTRRVHLVWQLQDLRDEIAAKDMIDVALDEDTFDNGYILRVSIYFESRKLPESPEFHRRVTLYNGSMNLPDLLKMEMKGEYNQTGSGKERGEMLVTVSANERIRDRLRGLVQINLDKKVRLLELEYQPSEKGHLRRHLFGRDMHNYQEES